MKHKVNKSLFEIIPNDLTASELKQMEDLSNFLEKSNLTAKKSLDHMIDICVNCYCCKK